MHIKAKKRRHKPPFLFSVTSFRTVRLLSDPSRLSQGDVRRKMDLTAAMVMAGSGYDRVADGDTLPCRTETFRGL